MIGTFRKVQILKISKTKLEIVRGQMNPIQIIRTAKIISPNKDSAREYLESTAVDEEESQETKTDYLVADLSDDISFPLIDNFSNELNSNKGSNCATLRHSQSAASMASSNNSTQGYWYVVSVLYVAYVSYYIYNDVVRKL